MNERQRDLLEILLVNANTLFQIEKLRKSLDCSEKTVRNDLNLLATYLEAYPGATLTRKPGMGIMLEVKEETQAEIFRKMYQVKDETDEERMIEIAYHLLVSSHPITLKQLAEEYFTTLVEIKQDFERIGKWLIPFQLQIITRQRMGSIVEGEEFNKRNALAHLSELVSSPENRNCVLDFFPKGEIAAVQQMIRDTQLTYELELTDGRFESLVIHALIMIKRTRQRTPVIVSDDDAEKTVRTKGYEITTYLLHKLEDLLALKFPINEQVYYAWHMSSSIQGVKVMDGQLSNGLSGNITQEIIQKVEYLTHIPFTDDQVLIDGLVIHVDAVMKRISYGFHITNPMLKDIRKLYPYLFSMVIFATNDVGEQYDMYIPEAEVAYVVLHFQASIERMEQSQVPKQVLVVCHMGIGMSRLLQAKLQQQYNGLTIIDCIAKNELPAFIKQKKKIDFIISTVPLPPQRVDHIVISPLLNVEDKAKVQQFIQEKKSESISSRYPALLHFITNGLFQKRIDLEHPFKVVERLADQLIRLDFVEEGFTHSALIRERTSFTSIGGKIAIPHAQPATVKRSTVSMAILKEPIEWGLEVVSIVFLLAISEKDRKMTQELLKEIATLSGDPILIEKLIQANNKAEVEGILHSTVLN